MRARYYFFGDEIIHALQREARIGQNEGVTATCQCKPENNAGSRIRAKVATDGFQGGSFRDYKMDASFQELHSAKRVTCEWPVCIWVE
jgi:hypothetical protein